jgi:formate hydrogenlyase transcriptional activator
LREERQAALARGLPFEIEQRALRKDGRYRWFLIKYNPFRDEKGNLVRRYATGTDIDDRKRHEERTQNENVALREEIVRSSMFEEIVGSSESLRRVLAEVTKVAPTDSTVLIHGETGTGKELIARAVHNRSRRASRAFIRVNCVAIPPALIASELFGHEKGSFTGALQRRLGRFESADGGTIFLDEIGELAMETQVALLRILQEREFERLGGNQSIPVDVRILAATNKDLSAAVSEGAFREDLFYRLNVFPIQVPPLRDRAGDIPLLVEYLVERYAQKAGYRATNASRAATVVMPPDRGLAMPKITSKMRPNRMSAGSTTAAIPNAIARKPRSTSLHQLRSASECWLDIGIAPTPTGRVITQHLLAHRASCGWRRRNLPGLHRQR